ncbi:MAG: methyltransferase [Hyphomicrobiales bacterium]|nr:methyltransferase [Hyphomicrobiales bacterium]
MRDRLIGSAAFQRWAAGFPGVRGIARRHERALFDISAGFVYSQVLFACVRLRLFESLASPLTPAEFGARAGLAPDAAERLLKAAASLRLAARRGGGRYGLGLLGAAMKADPGIAAMVEHHAMLYADLRDPVALLRGEAGDTQLAAYWPYADARAAEALPGEAVSPYTALMSASQPGVAAETLAAYNFRRHRRLMDVGGGDGAFLLATARAAPNLELVLFDLPAVAERAAARFAEAGLGARASAIGGDFRGQLPGGADLITLVRVLLDHDDATALRILKGARAALAPGGALLIAEPLSEGGPVADAYFGLYLLAMGRGRARSFAEHKAILTQAGFARIRRRPTRRPLLASVIHATVGQV